MKRILDREVQDENMSYEEYKEKQEEAKHRRKMSQQEWDRNAKEAVKATNDRGIVRNLAGAIGNFIMIVFYLALYATAGKLTWEIFFFIWGL